MQNIMAGVLGYSREAIRVKVKVVHICLHASSLWIVRFYVSAYGRELQELDC